MNIPNRMTRAEAEAAGFEVDTHCYPWVAYKGPRFSPTERREVFTDLEAEFVGRLKAEERRNLGMGVEISMLTDDADRIRWALAQGEAIGEPYLIIRDRLLDVQHACTALTSYQPAEIEVDAGNKGLPRITAIFRKGFGDSSKAEFIAEVRVVVTPEDFAVEAQVLRAGPRPLQRYDEHTSFREEPAFAFSVVSLLNRAVDESKKQIAYVVEKEGMPDKAQYGVLNAKV